jgi:hypothetical protein
MIATLVGIQAVCVGLTTFIAFKTSRRTESLKLVKKDKETGFKHFRPGGF